MINRGRCAPYHGGTVMSQDTWLDAGSCSTRFSSVLVNCYELFIIENHRKLVNVFCQFRAGAARD